MKYTFENIYETYCPMIYSIALQVCSSSIQAEKILLISFEKFYQQNTEWQKTKPFCIDLIKLIIKTAQEELHPGKTKCNFKVKQFENTPLLHKLLVEQLSLENYCIEYGITRQIAILNIRDEFKFIRKTHPLKSIDAGIGSLQLN